MAGALTCIARSPGPLRHPQALEIRSCVPGIVPRDFRSSELAPQPFQGGRVVNVIPGGQKLGRQADFAGAFERLGKNPLRAPVDVLEQPVVQLLDANQVVAPVIRATQDHSISGTRERLDRLQQSVLRHGGAIGIYQAHGAESTGKQVLANIKKTLSEAIPSLCEQLKSGG